MQEEKMGFYEEKNILKQMLLGAYHAVSFELGKGG